MATAKKASAKRTAAKRNPAKKKVAKKITAKKVTAKKVAAKQTPARKSPARTAIAKRASAKVAKRVTAPAKRAAKKAPLRRRGAAAARGSYDPRAQLDKLSEAPAGMRSRGMDGAPAAPTPRLPEEFYAARKEEPLGDQAFAEAAQALGCDVPAVRAVAEVESRGSGFDSHGRPTILYERHVFSRNTAPKGKFDAQFPDISFRKPYEKGTFGNGEQQYVKIARAYGLDPVAALKAPSWGMFQILGENHRACGCDDVKTYVLNMFTSPAAHLRAFVSFVRANPGMHKALIAHDWSAFARAYNGPGYAVYAYDKKIAAAHERHAAAAG